MNLREQIRLLLVPLSMAAIASAAQAQGAAETGDTQAPRIVAEVETAADIALTPQEESALSLTAGRILVHVDRARQAVAKQDQKGARAELDQARTLINIIEAAMPTYTVSTEITAGDLSYSSKDQVQPLMVDVFAELHQVAVLSPITAAKREAGEQAGGAGLPVMTEAGLRQTRTTLNVALAEAGVAAAEQAVRASNWDVADRALRGVQAGVIYHTVEVDLPLVRARTNLILARDALETGFVEGAKAALRVASDALERYGRGVGANRAEEAKALRGEIDRFAQELTEKTEGAPEQLMAWWQKITTWFE